MHIRGFLGHYLVFISLLSIFATSPAIANSDALESILSTIDDPYPLRAADTSSPRDTLRSFIRDYNAAIQAWQNDESLVQISRPMSRAADTFDFSDIPAFDRLSTTAIRMALLKEILDRVQLPPYEQIPGNEEVAQNEITRWTIPNTKIEIVKESDGPKSGQFIFSRETVSELQNYYELAKDLPYLKGAFVNLYDDIRTSPGFWLPRTFSSNFPEWATYVVWGQGVWQWISLFVLLFISAVLIRYIYILFSRLDKARNNARYKVKLWIPLALVFCVIIAEFVDLISLRVIGLLGPPLKLVSYVVIAVQVFSLAWLVLVISDRLADFCTLKRQEPSDQRRFDAALMRILFRLLSIVMLVFLGVYAAEFVGIPIAPLLAGLGVGGLAIALAIRPTLENVIGGLTLFADRPVRVGDFCAYGDKIGTVEEIGLRSTRIRSLERSIVTVPNAEFAQMQIDNFAARDQRLFKTILQLRYETTPDQLRYVLADLRKMLLGHPMVTASPARVRFVGYGAYSLDLEVFAYLRCQDQDEFLAAQEDILLRIADIVNNAGSGFAFPSQTMYYTRDSGNDSAQTHVAEAAVEDWRSRGSLPFPNFDPALRWEMEDILDYPPRGAYNYVFRKGTSAEPAATVNRDSQAGEPVAQSSLQDKSTGPKAIIRGKSLRNVRKLMGHLRRRR